MNDPRRPERSNGPLTSFGPRGSQGYQSPPLADPAYADQTPHAATYGGQVSQWAGPPGYTAQDHSTRPLPRSWQQDQSEHYQVSGALPPPHVPKSPRWLMIVAILAVVLVVGLIIALIITNGESKTQTAIEPLPAMPGPTATYTPAPRTTRTPSAAPAPPIISGPPTAAPEPGVLQPVVYTVTGEGRVISIMYVDTGDIVQTEFNVALPWTKQVSLSRSPTRPASVTILNFGHNVSCSVTVAGVLLRQRDGAGLTICDAPTP